MFHGTVNDSVNGAIKDTLDCLVNDKIKCMHDSKDDDLIAPIARMSRDGEDHANSQQVSTSLKLEERFSKMENGNQIILLVKYMEVLLDYILKWIIPGDGIFDIFESIIIHLIC